MLELFKLCFVTALCYLFFLIIKDKIFRYIVLMVFAISLFGSGYIWCVNVGNALDQKLEAVNKKIDNVTETVDKFNDSTDKVIETKDKVAKTTENIEKKLNGNKLIDAIDRRLKSKWLGRDKKGDE